MRDELLGTSVSAEISAGCVCNNDSVNHQLESKGKKFAITVEKRPFLSHYM